MTIGINRLPDLIDTVTVRHKEDVKETLDRLDEARAKLERVRQERKDYSRSVNEKLNPPPASPLQSAVQTTADCVDTAATVVITATLATTVLSGTFTVGMVVIVLHHCFDKVGGYEWLKDNATERLGWSEQTARTAIAALRILSYGASIWYGATKVAAGITTVAANFQNGYATDGIWSGIQGAFAPAESVSQGALKFFSATMSSVAFVSQSKMLEAHHKTTKGQLQQARGLEIDQDTKDAREGVLGPAKHVKTLRLEEKDLHYSYKKMADALDINLGRG